MSQSVAVEAYRDARADRSESAASPSVRRVTGIGTICIRDTCALSSVSFLTVLLRGSVYIKRVRNIRESSAGRVSGGLRTPEPPRAPHARPIPVRLRLARYALLHRARPIRPKIELLPLSLSSRSTSPLLRRNSMGDGWRACSRDEHSREDDESAPISRCARRVIEGG